MAQLFSIEGFKLTGYTFFTICNKKNDTYVCKLPSHTLPWHKIFLSQVVFLQRISCQLQTSTLTSTVIDTITGKAVFNEDQRHA